jgi:hypothetical protein
METDPVDAIAALLVEAEAAHGTYETTQLGGVYDQDWPRWYAQYAVEHGIGERIGREVAPERLARLLSSSFDEFERADPKPAEPWATYVARRLSREL